MKLTDLLEPESKTKDKTSLRDIVRSKGFKSMIRALSNTNNPKDENHGTGHLVGDGERESDTASDNQTKDLM